MSKTERIAWCTKQRNRNAAAWFKDQQQRKVEDKKEIERARKARTIGEMED